MLTLVDGAKLARRTGRLYFGECARFGRKWAVDGWGDADPHGVVLLAAAALEGASTLIYRKGRKRGELLLTLAPLAFYGYRLQTEQEGWPMADIGDATLTWVGRAGGEDFTTALAAALVTEVAGACIEREPGVCGRVWESWQAGLDLKLPSLRVDLYDMVARNNRGERPLPAVQASRPAKPDPRQVALL